ncbi:TPA: hypothetical protein N3H09_004557 [Salmonella enterica subsp. enterica serovar Java]|nr:hypothetical protein [Salmonella enterica subsp. enterica serovar Java]
MDCIDEENFACTEIRRTAVFNSIECDYDCWRCYCVCDDLWSEQVEKQNIA